MTDQPASERSIFEAAIEKRLPAERAAYVDQACGSDAALRQEVEALLAAHDRLGSIASPATASALAATVGLPVVTEAPGSVIGPYKLLEQIGEGGFGVVFMAEQMEPIRRRVALKVLKPGMDTRQVIARFEAERQALALMDHPNIAKVFDGGMTGEPGCVIAGRPYFVMELVRGVPITEFCDQHQLSPRQRLELFVPVCQAVQHAHQKGIIHRDLKPSNVLVSRHDATPVVKVIDFGVAKALGQTLTDKTLFTGIAQMIGTPLYMSPEQAGMSDLDVDTRSDIYSLGVLLYELLTGTTPFTKERFKQAAYDEIRRIIREEEPPKPSTRLSDSKDSLPSISAQRHTEPAKLTKLVRGELDWIVMKALEKDRNRRYETANGFAMDVQRYLADEAVMACPPSVGYRLRKFTRRNTAALVTAALFGVVVLAAVASIAGTVGWTARERSVRQAKLNSEVELALQEAGRARELALTQTGNPYQWEATLATALAALKRGEGIAAQDESALDPDVRERLQALNATLDADENDRRFVARFDEIRLEQSDVDAETFRQRTETAFPAIREAFQALYRVDFETTSVATAVSLIQQRPKPIQAHLLDALELSRSHVPKDNHKAGPWLDVLLKGVDNDPWRERARKIVPARDWPALEQLINHGIAARRPPAFLRSLVLDIPPEAASTRLRLLRRIQLANPGDFWVNRTLAFTLMSSKPPQWDEAIRYYTVALALRPRSRYQSLGVALLEKGDLDSAIATFQQALTIDPGDAMAHNSLGNAFKGKGDLDAAIAEYRRAITLHPRYALPHYNLGRALKGKGLLDEAIAEYRHSIDLDPKFALAHNSLGNAVKDKGDREGAIACYRRAVAIDPMQPFAHHNLGLAFMETGELDVAIAAFRRSIEVAPKFAQAHCALGHALNEKGDLEGAIACFREAIKMDPKYSLAHLNLGVALSDKDRFDEAVAEYREAIRLTPDDARVYHEWAWLLANCADAKQRDPAQAVALAKKAVQLSPKQRDFWNTLGAAHYRAGNWKESLDTLQKSMELSKGGDSNDRFFLAMAHWKLGNKEEARKWYDRAVERMEKNQPKDEQLRRFRAEAAELLGVKKKMD